MADDFLVHWLFSFLFAFLITLYKEKAVLSRKGRKFVRQMPQKGADVRQKRAYVGSFWAFFGLFASVCVKRFFLTIKEGSGIIEREDTVKPNGRVASYTSSGKFVCEFATFPSRGRLKQVFRQKDKGIQVKNEDDCF
jgi:hypothetical protein